MLCNKKRDGLMSVVRGLHYKGHSVSEIIVAGSTRVREMSDYIT